MKGQAGGGVRTLGTGCPGSIGRPLALETTTQFIVSSASDAKLAGSGFLEEPSSICDAVDGPGCTAIATKYDERITSRPAPDSWKTAASKSRTSSSRTCVRWSSPGIQMANDAMVHGLVLHAQSQQGPVDPACWPSCYLWAAGLVVELDMRKRVACRPAGHPFARSTGYQLSGLRDPGPVACGHAAG